MFHHVVHGIDFDFAFLITVEGELDCHALGGLHQQRSVVAVGGMFWEACAARLSSNWARLTLAPSGALPSSTLRLSWGSIGVLHRLAKMGKQANGLDDFLFLQGNDATSPCSARAVPPDPFRPCPCQPPPGMGTLGTLPRGAPPGTPEPPALAP